MKPEDGTEITTGYFEGPYSNPYVNTSSSPVGYDSLETRYKKETGDDATYEEEDRYNCNRSDMKYYESYVLWLEELVDKLEA